MDKSLDKVDNSFDTGKALQLRLVNKLSYDQIATQLDAPTSTVHARLAPFIKLLGDPEAIQGYRDNKAQLLDAAQMQLVSKLLDDDKVKKATLGNVAYALDKVDQMTRLERGQATSNVNVHQLTADISKIDDEIYRLEQMVRTMEKQDLST